MYVFVTVGSTKFDDLVNTVLQPSTLNAFVHKGYTDVVIQCGSSDIGDRLPQEGSLEWRGRVAGVQIVMYRFKPSLQDEYERADLVVSHAGSGTIIDVLRLGKPLIVVPNATLLDNHQDDLSTALADMGHLTSATTTTLPEVIRTLDVTKVVPFPQLDGSRFRDILDSEMGL